MQPLPPPGPRRTGVRAWLPVGLAVVLLANLLAVVAFAVDHLVVAPDTAKAGDAHRRPAPTSLALPGHPDEARAGRETAVQALLAERARAVLAGDREAFLATVHPAAQRYRERQARLFDNLTAMPLAELRYELAPDGGSLPVDGRLRQYGTEAWVPRLILSYRLRGFDAEVVRRTTYLGFVRHPARGWLVGGSGDRDGYRGDREIWELGAVNVAEGNRSVVVGVDLPEAELESIAAGIDRAEPVVSRVWGRAWSRRAVVLVARTHREASVISADRQDLSQIAALATVASGPGGVPPPGTGDRIVVDYQNFRKLSRDGRQVVLTHELTHVATRGATSSRMPLWLVEGLADYVGYQAVDTPIRYAAGDLAAAAEARRLPRRLPSRADFDASADDLSRTYAEAWLACRFIADRYGEDRLVRLYRVMGGMSGSEERIEAAALHSVLDVSRDGFRDQWRSYLRKRLG